MRGPLGRRGLDIALGVLVLLLLAGAVVGGFYVVREHQDREQGTADQERYGDVLAAARKEITAFVNIDYRNAEESMAAVAEGATGDFAEEYASSTEGVGELLTRAKSVMEGEVLWAGVSDVDRDSATVIAATTGTVSNNQSGNKPVARQFRLKVDLVLVNGEWKTSNVEFVE